MREHEGFCQYCDAVEQFKEWVAEHDPDGAMTLLEQVEAYADADITTATRIPHGLDRSYP